jgi:hypothetical protein
MTYENWYALNYCAIAGQSVLVIEQFNIRGVMYNADVMAGPRATWEIEGDAEMKNRKAIAQGTHISCYETRKKLAAHSAKKGRKGVESVRPEELDSYQAG